MFKGFGISDPFKDDPFFNGKGGSMFGGGIDKIMKDMRGGMMDMDSGFSNSMGGNQRF